MTDPFRRARLRITAWYVGVFAVILVLFGGAIYLAVTRQIERALDRQLVAAMNQLERAVQARPRVASPGATPSGGTAMPTIAGRDLYLLDAAGTSADGSTVPAFVVALIPEILEQGEVWARPETAPEASWRVYGRRLEHDGAVQAAVVVASDVELTDQYSALLTSFILAAIGALVLVAAGGAMLARQSLQPVEELSLIHI